MKTLKLPELTPKAIKELDRLYRTARDPRLRTRAHIVLLAAEKSLRADEIAEIVRTDSQTVRRWLKRYLSQGLNGFSDALRPGGPRKVTDAYLALLVEVVSQPPSAMELPYPHWTAHRLAEYMAARTDIVVNPETVRLHLKTAGISLGKPQDETTPVTPKTGRAPSKRPTSK